jgi:hypothetical protein
MVSKVSAQSQLAPLFVSHAKSLTSWRPGRRWVCGKAGDKIYLSKAYSSVHFLQSGPTFHRLHHLLIVYSIITPPMD